ncbi:MAG: ABC transporter permease [Thiohalophilus sp.]
MDHLSDAFTKALQLLVSGDRELWIIVATSFSVSLRAILIASPIAIAIGFLLAMSRFPGQRSLVMIFQTLQAVPAVVVGLTVYIVLSRQGPLGEWRLLFTQTAMIVGQILLCLPLLISMAHATFAGADRRAWETARTLGAGRVQATLTFFYELRFALLAAIIAGFGRIIAEVGSSVMVGGNILHHTRNIPTAIALETAKGEYAQGLALGIVLLLLAFGLNALLHLSQQQRPAYA